MSEKKISDTIKQQREARKDFLELKKMQHGEMDTGPKPSEVAIVPKTPKEKLSNIWFHYKWVIIGLLLTLIFIIVMVKQCADRIDYDLEIVLYTKSGIVSDNSANQISKYFEKYCEDVNGDKEVHVQVINCTNNGNSNDFQYNYTMNTKLQAILAADANALLFITDNDGYEYLSGISKEGSIFEGEPKELSENFYKECDIDSVIKLPENLKISIRMTSKTPLERDKNIEKYISASKKILNDMK